MKKITRIKLFSIAILFASSTAFGQLNKVGQLLGGGVDDAGEIMEAYMTPFFNAFGASINGGWYNTAKPHKLGGFDLTFTVNTAMAPEGALTYDLNDLNLNGVVTGDGISPTFSGSKDPTTSSIQYIDNTTIPGTDITLADIDMPRGSGVKFVPAPVIKLGIGFIKDTELSGRYMPAVNLGKTNITLWGVGMKHSLKQYIPAIKKLPLINFSLQAGYTKLTTTNDLLIEPPDMGLIDETTDVLWTDINDKWNDQQMILDITGFTTNLLFSVDAPVINIYCGAGIATSKANLALKGIYPMASTDINDIANLGNVTNESVKIDPLDIEVKNREGGVTKPRLNAGFRLKFSVITFHFDYTRAYYNVFTGGFGISVR